ncbi:MAG: DUF1501 domain-containing protein [Planctomycetes bacterium]|nr:DUF1501 domain-containing protein [Planctomycetota bacterium]
MYTNPFVDVLEESASRSTRRAFLKVAALGGASVVMYENAFGAVPSLIQQAQATRAVGKAKRCIFLYLQGGPSHLDTFDPKPGTPNGGEFKARDTSVSGIQISEHFPGLASEMGDICIIRSMTTKEGNHDRGRYLIHTGYAPQAAVQHADWGSILSHEIANKEFDLPAFVSVGGGAGTGGYFGGQYSPFNIQRASSPLEDVAIPAGVSKDRYEDRRKLLLELDTRFAKKTNSPAVEPHEHIYKRADRLMKSPLLAAFDITKEDPKVRDAYGKEEFGQGVLLARRLVEVGVSCVHVSLNGWDTHQNNFPQVQKLSSVLDTAMSQLMRDLRSRNLLKDTLIVCMGEFGRTPKINGNGGRDHFPKAWSAVLAGGGIKGGQVVGSTSPDGMEVKDQPVTIPDLYRSIGAAFGIDTNQVNFAGPRPITMVDKAGKLVSELLA